MHRLQLKVKQLSSLNKEYEKKIKEISKDRHYRTTKLNEQLSKFKELHTDAIEETTELMDEVLKLKRSLEKSEAVCDAHEHALMQKRKDVSNLERQLFENEKRVSNIFKEKLELQNQFDILKDIVANYKSEIATKDEEIEKLKDEMAERTQTLKNQNHALTQRLEQKEVIQHSYQRSSIGPALSNLSSLTSSSAISLLFPQKIKAATAHHRHGSTFGSGELIMTASTMNDVDDAIRAEQALMAQADYLQKQATERLKNRQLSPRQNTKRQNRLAVKFKGRKIQTVENLKKEKKKIASKIEETEKKLEYLRNTDMPEDKSERLTILLEIASVDDDLLELKRKLKSINNRIKKIRAKSNSIDSNSGGTPNASPRASKLTDFDAMNYIDAALSMTDLNANED